MSINITNIIGKIFQNSNFPLKTRTLSLPVNTVNLFLLKIQVRFLRKCQSNTQVWKTSSVCQAFFQVKMVFMKKVANSACNSKITQMLSLEATIFQYDSRKSVLSILPILSQYIKMICTKLRSDNFFFTSSSSAFRLFFKLWVHGTEGYVPWLLIQGGILTWFVLRCQKFYPPLLLYIGIDVNTEKRQRTSQYYCKQFCTCKLPQNV